MAAAHGPTVRNAVSSMAATSSAVSQSACRSRFATARWARRLNGLCGSSGSPRSSSSYIAAPNMADSAPRQDGWLSRKARAIVRLIAPMRRLPCSSANALVRSALCRRVDSFHLGVASQRCRHSATVVSDCGSARLCCGLEREGLALGRARP